MPTYSVHTAKSQDYQGSVPSQRQYGYVIRTHPPLSRFSTARTLRGLDGGRITHHDDMHSILLDGIATKQTHYRDWKNAPKLRLYMSTNATHTIKELAHACALRLAQRWMQPPDPDHAEQDARYTKDVETIARARANAKGKKAAQRSLKPHRLNR